MALHSPSTLKKSDQAYLSLRSSESGPPHGPVETEAFEFKGDLVTITAIAPSGTYSGYFRVDNGLQRPMTWVAAPDMSYPCVHVEDGIVFVYGSSLDHQRILMMWSTDLVNWSAPEVVFSATAGMGFYNTSIAKHTMSGTYRMVVETTDPAYPSNPFVLHLLSATNPKNWSILPPVFKNDLYVNCPMIRYVGDVLYMAFMEWTGSQHVTFIARSFDKGVTWERGLGADGQTAALVPIAGEGNNNSDMTLCEFKGQTYILYGRGDQTAWLDCVSAVWPGTMKAYFEQFFPNAPTSPAPANLIPLMTGETTSGVTITASSVHAGIFVPWYAGDRDQTTFWHCADTNAYPHWLQVGFAAPHSVTAYSIKARSGLPEQGPKNFTFQGYNGADWVSLDTQTNQSYTNGVAKTFTLSSSASYAQFRLLVSANFEGSANLSIAEIEVVGT